MELKKEEDKKYLSFKGRNYVAVPEIAHCCCKGCDLLDKGCYNSVRALAICRQGYIFKKIRN